MIIGLQSTAFMTLNELRRDGVSRDNFRDDEIQSPKDEVEQDDGPISRARQQSDRGSCGHSASPSWNLRLAAARALAVSRVPTAARKRSQFAESAGVLPTGFRFSKTPRRVAS